MALGCLLTYFLSASQDPSSSSIGSSLSFTGKLIRGCGNLIISVTSPLHSLPHDVFYSTWLPFITHSIDLIPPLLHSLLWSLAFDERVVLWLIPSYLSNSSFHESRRLIKINQHRHLLISQNTIFQAALWSSGMVCLSVSGDNHSLWHLVSWRLPEECKWSGRTRRNRAEEEEEQNILLSCGCVSRNSVHNCIVEDIAINNATELGPWGWFAWTQRHWGAKVHVHDSQNNILI